MSCLDDGLICVLISCAVRWFACYRAQSNGPELWMHGYSMYGLTDGATRSAMHGVCDLQSRESIEVHSSALLAVADREPCAHDAGMAHTAAHAMQADECVCQSLPSFMDMPYS